jgi:flagellar basal-body rod protein FlgB
MAVSGAPLINAIGTAMKSLSERQRVVAQNIANSETPGFKARDVTAPDFAGLLGADDHGGARVPRPQVTITAGMAALGARQPTGGHIVIDAGTSETKPDGNNVVLEDQLLKMGQMQADYAALTNIYKKQMGLLKIATGRGGG